LRKPRLPLFGRLVEASPAPGRRGPAPELFALVHGRRAQASATAAVFATTAATAFSTLAVVGTLQRVHVQIGIVPGPPGMAGGGFEHGVVQVVGGGAVALRMEWLRLAADVRV